jgi:VWFA-related protein
MQYQISRRRLFALLPALPAAKLLMAQQVAPQNPPEQQKPANPTFSTGVNVVNVFATVHDKDGHIVSDLGKENFALQEDGHSQTIAYFARETDLPLTLGLLVDTSLSQRRVLGEERTASYSFLDHVLREDKDHAFVIHFDKEVELLQDLTSSRAKLQKALQELELPQDSQQQQQSGGGGGRRGGGSHHGGTMLYDSILLSSDELMKKQKGRKAVILLTDGVDNGSKVSIIEAIESAQRSDTLVYSIYFTGSEGLSPGFGGFGRGGMGGGRHGGGMPRNQDRPDGKKVLQRISKETGGGYFEVTHKQPVDKIYERIQEELRSQYSLGYTSDQPNSEGGYRRISLTVDKKGLIVQTRDGYYPSSPPPPA